MATAITVADGSVVSVPSGCNTLEPISQYRRAYSMCLGKWGRLVMRNLEEHHPERLEAMREAGTLDAQLAELDQLGDRMSERLLMLKFGGPNVPEGSLARMQFAQAAQSEVEEVVLHALLDPPTDPPYSHE